MTLARLYGRVQGHGSLAVVTEGFRSVLADAALLAGLCPLDVAEVPEEENHAGASARHGIYTGALGQVEDMFKRGLHQHYWIMVAPNSNRLPPDLVHTLTELQEKHHRRVHLMAPSAWATDVVNKHFVGHQGPCLNVPHGVSPEYHVRADLSDQARASYQDTGAFRVMHFSTSARQRKGTVELIQAWAKLKDSGSWDPNTELLCVMDYQAQLALLDALADLGLRLPHAVRIVDRADLTPQAMAQNLARAHLVCQPSRGEAFGLIPLEALCCGVPVAVTACTGHSGYLLTYYGIGSLGAVIIKTGELEPIDDLPGSSAPSLNEADIRRALHQARSDWRAYQHEALEFAPEYQKKWAWKVTLAPFVELLRNT
jgi:glycosyltransferase involved in cell wall biosynthesis